MQHTQKNNRLQNHNNRQPPPVTTVIGKVPPQSIALEEAVLGLCLLDTKAFDVVSEILCPEAFYSDAHQRIFKAFAALNRVCQPIDMLTVCNQLIKTKELEMIGGPYSVTKLTNAVVSGANVQDHARIILQKFIQRELIRIGNEITVDAYDEGADVFDLLDETEAKVYAITNNYVKHDYANAINILSDVVSRVDFLRANPQSFTGVTSGFACIDNITHGWQPTDLIILAARPGVGKTAFALNLARNACLNSAKLLAVGFFSLEMSAPQLMQRVVSAESGVPLENIMRGKLTEAEYDKFMKDGVLPLEKTHMYIDDTPALNIFELRSRARRMVNKHGVGLLIIDYLQLMRGHGDRATREQEISTISRNLKALAKELNVPVIALSQLSRAVETRNAARKMPQLSDLRESGSIEQDADVVLFIYRKEYYDNDGDTNNEAMNAQHNTTQGETIIKFAKHRNGKVGIDVKLQSQLWIQKFVE